jgi:hypothetical protein
MFRPVSKADVVAEKALTENSIWWIVREYAQPRLGEDRAS